jgi:peptide/nickel transport system substrate-binding protein
MGKILLALSLLFLIAACTKEEPKEVPFRIVTTYDPDDLDPHISDTQSTIAVSGHFYEALVNADANLRIQPGLATHWENPDDQTVIFHLRPNVVFHNGKRLNSRDVVYSFQRLNQDPSLEMRVYARDIQSVRALDDRTVEMKTVKPSAIFLNKLRMISIVPDGTSRSQLLSAETGTGPYQLLEFQKKSVLRAKRFDRYWGKPADIDFVELQLAADYQTGLHLLENNEAELIQCNLKTHSKHLEIDPRFRFFRSDSLFVKYITFNLTDPQNPFQNHDFRKAVHLAINREKLVSNLTYHAVPATQPVPVFVFGFNPEIRSVVPEKEAILKLFGQSEWSKQRLPVSLQVRKMFEETAHLLKTQLEQYGVRLEIQTLTEEQFFAKRKEIPVTISRFACTTGDASDLLNDLLYSSEREGFFRDSDLFRYTHPDLPSSESQTPGSLIEHRRHGLQRIMASLMEDLLVIPLYVDQDAYFISRKYKWTPRFDGLILAHEITLNAETQQ